jgi:hypothetical protein
MLEVNTSDAISTFNIADFNPGSYFIRVTNQDKNVVETLIVY